MFQHVFQQTKIVIAYVRDLHESTHENERAGMTPTTAEKSQYSNGSPVCSGLITLPARYFEVHAVDQHPE